MGLSRNPRKAFLRMMQKHTPVDVQESEHSSMRRRHRGVPIERIIRDLFEPGSLRYVFEQEITENNLKRRKGYRKFVCFYSRDRRVANRYVICLNKNIFIVSVLPIVKRWQRHVKKFRRIPF